MPNRTILTAGRLVRQCASAARRTLAGATATAQAVLVALPRPSPGARVVAAAVTGVVAMGAALSASSTPDDTIPPDIDHILGLVGSDLSDAALFRLASGLDPAARALALRHDPASAPLPWGLTPGWETLSLGGKPPLDPGAASGAEAQRLNAALPAVRGALSPARPFAFATRSEADARRALRCLSQAIYYEAALEPRRGQEAVAQVVLNRVRDPNYPASVCGVVYQGAERTTGCQFSFTCDGSLARPPVAWAWRQAEAVARQALNGHVAAEVGTATHYHADYVLPWWSPSVTKVGQLGAHIFYRWTGRAGETAAFRQAYSGREPVIDEARFARPRLVQASTPATLEAAGVVAEARTVIVDGRERQVGIISLGGRRQPTRDEVAEINARLEALVSPAREPAPAPAPAPAAPAGVTPLDVVEVGRPPA